VNGKKDPLRTTVLVCGGGALLALAAGLGFGIWKVGLAVALGLTIGSVNGFLARGALGVDVSFRFTSVGRLLLLSVAAVGVGAVLGLQYAALVLVGMAIAQLVLAIVSGVSSVRA
jgi:hypothetical protein